MDGQGICLLWDRSYLREQGREITPESGLNILWVYVPIFVFEQ